MGGESERGGVADTGGGEKGEDQGWPDGLGWKKARSMKGACVRGNGRGGRERGIIREIPKYV